MGNELGVVYDVRGYGGLVEGRYVGRVEELFAFWRVPAYGFVELRSRGADGLASPGFSGTRPVKRNVRILVDRTCGLAR